MCWPVGMYFSSSSILCGVVPSKGLFRTYQWPANMSISMLNLVFSDYSVTSGMKRDYLHFVSPVQSEQLLSPPKHFPSHSMEWWQTKLSFSEAICYFLSFSLCCYKRACAHPALQLPAPTLHRQSYGDEKSPKKNKIAKANMFLTSQPITLVIWEHKNTNWE